MGEHRGAAVLNRRTVDSPIRIDTRSPREAARSRRRALTLIVLTAVMPGSAQVAVGNKDLGRIALRVWAGILGSVLLLGLLFVVSRQAALTVVMHRWTLAVVQWSLFGLAAAWLLLFVDAWRLGRPDLLPRRDRRTLLVTLVVAALVLCGGTAWAGRTVGEARSAMSSLFASGEALAASNGRYNVLLLGGDSGAGRVGLRPDSIQLASIDAETGRAVLFGFSRETELITFQPGSTMARLMPEGWTCGDECLLNGLYTWAQEHADQFPPGTTDPGVVATTEAVESLTDLDVQYHVLVDLKGFSSLVDAVGGLDIAVQRRTPIGGGASPIRGWIEPGVQHLDGYHALWYARSRTKSTNYERMARQRCVVTALVRQLDPQTVVLNMGDILAATTGVFHTNIPQEALPALADVAVRTKQQKITSVNFVPPLIDPWDYDPQVVRDAVASAIATSERSDKTAASPTATWSAAADSGSGTASGAEPRQQAVMERPGSDPDADTADLARVCSAG